MEDQINVKQFKEGITMFGYDIKYAAKLCYHEAG